MKKSIVNADYQGMTVSFGEDGWFNATEAAKHFGKKVVEWLRLPSTEEYIEALRRNYEQNQALQKGGKIPPFVKTRHGLAARYFPRAANLAENFYHHLCSS